MGSLFLFSDLIARKGSPRPEPTVSGEEGPGLGWRGPPAELGSPVKNLVLSLF